MIFIPSLRSKKLTKASKFRNLINMARLDWKLIKFWKFDFIQKSNLIYIECWLILANYHPKSIQYKYMMHTYQERTKKLTQKPYSKFKKSVAYKQLASLVPACFKQFWAFHLVPCHPLNRSRPSLCPKPSRIKESEFGMFLKNSKSCFIIHALLTCFVFVFVISDEFASILDTLIEFPWPETRYAMIRVSYAILGFHRIG